MFVWGTCVGGRVWYFCVCRGGGVWGLCDVCVVCMYVWVCERPGG